MKTLGNRLVHTHDTCHATGMTPQLAQIYATGYAGQTKVADCIDPEEGRFLASLIANNPVRRVLEIGCAHGISSLWIAGALKGREGAYHVIFDPFQDSDWNGEGRRQLKIGGYGDSELYQNGSEFELPEYVNAKYCYIRDGGDGRKVSFDLIFVDGCHQFDHKLVDCFYAARLLPISGLLVIDDTDHPQIARVVDYIRALGFFEVAGCVASEPRPQSLKHRLAKVLIGAVPAKLRRKVIHPALLRRLFEPECRMMAFRKTVEDKRPWNWGPEGF